MVILKKEMNMNSNIVGNVNVDGDKIFYSPDTNNLDSTPSCDVFGYLIASSGLTVHTDPLDVVEKLFELKRTSTVYAPFITTILENILCGDIMKPASWAAAAKHSRGSIFDAEVHKSFSWTGPNYL